MSRESYLPIESKLLVAGRMLRKEVGNVYGFVNEFYDKFVYFPQGAELQKINEV
jgi:hypothetical protein